MRYLLSFSLVMAIATVASADPPAYIKKFMENASSCSPSCYKREPAVPWGDQPFKRVCGYKDWNFQQTKIGGRWSAIESRGIPAVDPTVTACKAPKDGGGIAKQARAAFAPLKGDLENLRFTPQGGWHDERDANLNPVRWQTVRIYASNWEQKPNECGTNSSRTACEASGSKTAASINVIRYRLDEAKKLADSDPEGCKTASFYAVAVSRGLRKFRDHAIAKKRWTTGVQYKTRYDGELDEKALFGKVDDYEKAALAVHKQCGGASPLVTEIPNDMYSTEPEFSVVPNPGEE